MALTAGRFRRYWGSKNDSKKSSEIQATRVAMVREKSEKNKTFSKLKVREFCICILLVHKILWKEFESEAGILMISKKS